MNVVNLIDRIVNDLKSNKNYYSYRHALIVGENNSGKSKVIKGIINKLKDSKEYKDKIYFIDSKNRRITVEISGFTKLSDLKTHDIIENRVDDKNFNKEDVFLGNHKSEVILNELIENSEEYKELLKNILDVDFRTSQDRGSENDEEEYVFATSDDKDGIEIYLNDESLYKLSDALQARLRMLVEVNFASKAGCELILIDELDMNLDHKNSGIFIEKLKEKYSNIRFIVSAHSLYTVQKTKDFDVIKIIKSYESVDKNPYQIFDGNDLNDIESIDKNIFNTNRFEDEKDIALSNLVKDCISGRKVSLDDIDENSLSIRQKVIYRFIEERSK
ncbi:hypothetical protein K5V21_16485 [Clostridium sardiniense]|uniref:AAA+ ATPase domain-containing protein n=1 Tax=Clostridium sardiniense TaxID=29369 RepID=A0ABS7L1U0_CLOSR|nr:hypothetical protein [Clostridium sardiniense]MBY0757040.1 hypothetical protein [Clostridium sardiniense]MDQ0462083.1 putative ATP-binding protein involved in virulence [Clostridium sardiniense]